MTEQEKMIAGKIYNSNDPELVKLRAASHDACARYNAMLPSDEKRLSLLHDLLPEVPAGLYLQGPIQFDYGRFIHFGKNVYANFNFMILDVCPVTIGDDVFFGPNVSLMTPMHPFLAKERNAYFDANGELAYREYGKPITIGRNCWIASNVVVCGGVEIGEGCVIGAGSVVTRDIPPHTLAAGNPCRVIRSISESDSIDLKKELW